MVLLTRSVKPSPVKFAPVAGMVMRRRLVGFSVLLASAVLSENTAGLSLLRVTTASTALSLKLGLRLKGSATFCLPGL